VGGRIGFDDAYGSSWRLGHRRLGWGGLRTPLAVHHIAVSLVLLTVVSVVSGLLRRLGGLVGGGVLAGGTGEAVSSIDVREAGAGEAGVGDFLACGSVAGPSQGLGLGSFGLGSRLGGVGERLFRFGRG